jgi:hypothetical protein
LKFTPDPGTAKETAESGVKVALLTGGYVRMGILWMRFYEGEKTSTLPQLMISDWRSRKFGYVSELTLILLSLTNDNHARVVVSSGSKDAIGYSNPLREGYC